MGRLDLRLEKEHLGADLDLGVVANVRQIENPDGRFPEWPHVQDYVIPAGGSGSAKSLQIDVPSGTYQIDARLPSGEVVSATQTVTDDPDPVQLVFNASQSSNEWLGWQRFLGNVPSQEKYEAWLTRIAEAAAAAAAEASSEASGRPVEPVKVDRTLIAKTAAFLRSVTEVAIPVLDAVVRRITFGHGPSQGAGACGLETLPPEDATGPGQPESAPKGAAKPAVDPEPPEFELLQWDVGSLVPMWTAVETQAAWKAVRAMARPSSKCVARRRDDRSITLWSIDQIERPGSSTDPPRVLAALRRGTDLDIVMLPVPWPLTLSAPPSPIELFCEGPVATRRTSVTVRDRDLGTLLAYANNKSFSDASTILRQADQRGLIEGLIEDKHSNPLAACIAAYIGLATSSGTSTPLSWVSWLRSLADGFKWLPDGAVIHGAYLLQAASTKADLDAALAAFKTAYRRGIPFYAAGVQQLMNGLYSFSSSDKEAKSMHECVARVALCIDPSQTFTVVTIPAAGG